MYHTLCSLRLRLAIPFQRQKINFVIPVGQNPIILLALLLGWATLPTLAQTTWTGSLNADWATSGNWTNGVPTTTTDVIIPGASSQSPVIGTGTSAIAQSVNVLGGGTLTISNGSSLTLTGAKIKAISTPTGPTFIRATLINEGTIHNNGQVIIGNPNSGAGFDLYNNATFNNNEGGSIQINQKAMYSLYNEFGTFTNEGSIIINSEDVSVVYGLYNLATFNNAKGSIEIDRSGGYCLTNAGGTFTNAATLILGSSYAAVYGLHNKATFNNTNGSIQIDHIAGYGLLNEEGTFTNEATITIGASTSAGAMGLLNQATFNNVKGSLQIDRASTYGLSNDGGTFNNSATITIGALASAGILGLYNTSQFNNNSGGHIQVDRTSDSGLSNDGGTFTNEATITIGSLAPVGNYSIFNNGTFTNKSCRGLIVAHYPIGGSNLTNNGGIIDKSIGSFITTNTGWIQYLGPTGFSITTNTGVYTTKPGLIWTGCTSTDWATATNWLGGVVPTAADDVVILTEITQLPIIGASTSAVARSVELKSGATLTIASSATLTISGSKTVNGTATALVNAGNVTNSGLLIIGNSSPLGLSNTGTMTNQSCAELRLSAGLSNSASFTNSGLLRIATDQPHTNTGLTNHGIIEYSQGNPIPNVTNNDLIISPFSTCSATSPALQIGGSNSFQVATTWYKDQNLTQAAGIYEPSTNTFTKTDLPTGTTPTLYFTVTDPGTSCIRTVSAAVTVNAPPSLTITATPSLTITPGHSVTLTASGATSYRWSTGASSSRIDIAPTTSTVYSMTGTGVCAATISVTVTVYNPVSATLSGSSTLCPGLPATLSVALAGTPPWSITYTDGVNPVVRSGITSSPHTFTVNPIATTTYTLLAVATDEIPSGGAVSGTAIVTRKTVALAPTLTRSNSSVIQNTPFVSLTISGCQSGLNWTASNNTSGTTHVIAVPTSAIATIVYSATCVSECPAPPGSTTIIVTEPSTTGSFDGFVNGADCASFRGWVWDRGKGTTVFNVEILDGPTVIGTLPAGDFRQDLLDAGKGNGKHSFRFTIPESVKDGMAHNLSARVAGSSFILKDSPKTLICQGISSPSHQAPVPPSPTVLVAPLTAQVGVPFSGTLVAFTDPEGQPLTYQLTGLPGGLSINETTRVIWGTPTESGTFVLAYSANDGELTNSVSFALTVNPAATTTVTGSFEGYLDKVECASLRGWVWDRNKPNTPLTVEFYTDGMVWGSTVANIYRDDLKAAGKGNGVHAYNFTVPEALKSGSHLIRARVLGSGYELKTSGRYLPLPCPSATRMSAETGSGLSVTVLGNPVSDQVAVEVQGVEGEPLRLQLINVSGRLVSQQQIEVAQAVEYLTLSVQQQPAGLLLLRVSSGLKSQTLTILKE